ncbi:MAG: single-stranded-DNA-specific exonuclease RecJ [Chloroflexota bacterium]
MVSTTEWSVPSKINTPDELLDLVGDPLLAQLLVQRGLTTPEQARAFLNPDNYNPTPPTALPDMDKAVTRLNQAIDSQETICVWGDFDADGQTSTALLVFMLQDLGANVHYYIPDRLTESHGIKLPKLNQILADGVTLILTCDTGIDAYDAIDTARAAGADVIITDHHDLVDPLPDALAIVNPKRLPEDHPLRELPGVGVAYKLAEALYHNHQRAADSEILLDLVAIGIVADVAQQTKDTRYLLQRGLAVLNQRQRLGLVTILENSNVTAEKLTEEHIGFWLAPRLNALGRLGDANLGVELLLTDDTSRARILALQLEALNDRRKQLVDRVVVQALGQIEDSPSLAEHPVIVLAAADWHPGVLGIAASRLAHRHGKPAILLAIRPEGEARGSARSVEGWDIHQAIKTQAHLLNGFGGHPMAAGLRLPADRIPTFRRGLSEALADQTSTSDQTVRLDTWVSLDDVSIEMLNTIQKLAPFGSGNPGVQLGAKNLEMVNEVVFGKLRNHKRLTVQDETGSQQQLLWWRGVAERSPEGLFDLVFTLSPDNYRSNQAVQLTWQAFREHHPPQAVDPIELIDWREQENIKQQVQNLTTESMVIWAEGLHQTTLLTLPRHQLHPADTLVVWHAPPAQDIFQQIIQVVTPKHIYLVGQPSELDLFPAFVKQLMGLVKYAIMHHEGEVQFEMVAAALGQRVETAQLALQWLVAQGKLSILVEEEDLLVVRPDHQAPDTTVSRKQQILQSKLAEAAAYRKFFKTARLKTIEKMLA